MSMRTDELRTLYRGYIGGQPPLRAGRCLGGKDWRALFDPRARAGRKDRLIEHITHCPDCVRRFELLLETERAGDGLAAAVGGLMGEAAGARPAASAPRGGSGARGLRWKLVPAFAALAIAALALLVLLTKDRTVFPGSDVTRGNQILEIKLLRPLDLVKRKDSLEFAWASPLRLESYRVDVYDEALVLIARSPSLKATRWPLPREILDALATSRRYVWMVSGSLASGDRIESPFGTFTLVK